MVIYSRNGIVHSGQGRKEHGHALKVVLAERTFDQIGIAEVHPDGISGSGFFFWILFRGHVFVHSLARRYALNITGICIRDCFRSRVFILHCHLLHLHPLHQCLPVPVIQDKLYLRRLGRKRIEQDAPQFQNPVDEPLPCPHGLNLIQRYAGYSLIQQAVHENQFTILDIILLEIPVDESHQCRQYQISDAYQRSQQYFPRKGMLVPGDIHYN